MKARSILMSLLIAMFSFCLSAQEQISANSDNLSKNQKSALAYAKRLLYRLDGKIALPLEVNMLLGDTITKEQYYATPAWETAYFKNVDGFDATIVLPINVKTPNGEVNSFLNIYKVNKTEYYRFVETIVKPTIPNKNIECYMISNVRGILLQNLISENGVIAEVQNSIVGYSGVIDAKSNKSNYDKKSMDRVLYKASEAGKWSIFKSHSDGLNWIKASSGPFNFGGGPFSVVRDGSRPRSK